MADKRKDGSKKNNLGKRETPPAVPPDDPYEQSAIGPGINKACNDA